VEGLRSARGNKPNLIILDLSMPDMNGFEVLDELKKDAATQGIPVVIHTSQTLESQGATAGRRGHCAEGSAIAGFGRKPVGGSAGEPDWI
jgi:CheY-like chemotaxis protein